MLASPNVNVVQNPSMTYIIPMLRPSTTSLLCELLQTKELISPADNRSCCQ